MKENYFKTNKLTNTGNPLTPHKMLSPVTFPSLVLARSHTTYNQQKKTETDFGEKDELNNGDALHGYDRLVGYPWALL